MLGTDREQLKKSRSTLDTRHNLTELETGLLGETFHLSCQLDDPINELRLAGIVLEPCTEALLRFRWVPNVLAVTPGRFA